MNDWWKVGAGLGVGALLLLVGSVTSAGVKSSGAVTITTQSGGSGVISGSFGGARHSTNENEYLACRVDYKKDGSRAAFCNATDSSGNKAVCHTKNRNLIDGINSLNEHRVDILFDETGECHTIYATVSSSYPSK